MALLDAIRGLLAAPVTRQPMATRALDDRRDTTTAAQPDPRDRRPYDRQEVLRDCLDAWRTNPLARRLVTLTSQYVVGDGIHVEADHAHTNAFLQALWNHPENRMPTRVYEWSDELTRSGELFVLMTTDRLGMSCFRAFPALDVTEIETCPDDLESPLRFVLRPLQFGDSPRTFRAYDQQDDGRGEDGLYPDVMFHCAINRPVGGARGESDLAPLLRWLARYAGWAEDRVRLNRFRQTFLYWVRKAFMNDAERITRQNQLNANPPNPGSILVTDEAETWAVLHPKLDSYEAKEDGLAIKKMVCAGAGVPLHFLAEPESSTRTTAEAAGGPTYRHYVQRQTQFLWFIVTLLRAATRRRAAVDRQTALTASIHVAGADISARDNETLARAAQAASAAFAPLAALGAISPLQYAAMIYRFAGEPMPPPDGDAKPRPQPEAKEDDAA